MKLINEVHKSSLPHHTFLLAVTAHRARPVCCSLTETLRAKVVEMLLGSEDWKLEADLLKDILLHLKDTFASLHNP